MARLIIAGEFVGPGEERSARYLEQHLPGSWTVICNKELVNRDGSVREVDFVIVGQHAVYVVEEKSWSGAIHGNDNGWVLRSGESFPSPLGKADSNARRLAGMLRSGVPHLADSLSGRHYVFGRVLLSSPNVQMYVNDPRRHDGVLHLEGAEEELLRFDKLQGLASIEPFRNKIVERLTGLQDRPKVPRQLGDYEILETVSTVGPIRAFRARHPDGSERILKLIPKPVTADSDRQTFEENRLLREYQALRKLATAGRAPSVDPYFTWSHGEYWVVPVHIPGGRSLRADRTDAAPDGSRVVPTFAAAFRALADVHATGVVHRALNPDRIHLVGPDQVVFSEFLIARLEGEQTIASAPEPLEPEDAYRAPECRIELGLAERTSDVYGLAASLFYWLGGHEPDETAFPRLDTLRADLVEADLDLLDSLLVSCLNDDERKRPQAETVAASLERALADRERAESEVVQQAELSPGAVIDDQHQIIRRLGGGGSAVSYLAEDFVAGGHFVLKSIRNPELVARLTRNEFAQLRDLHHPNLPRVFDVRPPGYPFHLKLEYVAGASLKELGQAAWGDQTLALRVAFGVLEALGYLAERNRIHRDVTPGNIIIPEEDSAQVKLIDFGLATDDADTSGAVGTPRYRPPEVDRWGNWTSNGDLYGLAAVLWEMLTGRLPYAVEDGIPRKHTPAIPTPDEESRFGAVLLQALLRAAHPQPQQRFQSAREFERALRDATTVEHIRLAEGEERVNPTVAALRGSYRNSRLGNADNRGMDTPFAGETYVETRLDTDLLPALLDGEHRVVVLSGNPGDGKTAFLQRLHDALLADGGAVEREDAAGWRIRRGERLFTALNDASESDGDRSADDLMHEVLAPFSGDGQRPGQYTTAIAANDGRLLDFFERHGAMRYPWLQSQLEKQRDPTAPIDDVVLVDLKYRAVVGYDPDDWSLFSQITDRFVLPERWSVCEGCVARLECPMRLNALSLRDPAIAPSARAHLHRMLLAVHLRRERRPTIRDLRSALAFLITHDLACEEVHAERQAGTSPLARTERLYFDASFNATGGPDLLLDEWTQLDPADVPRPVLDRFVYFHRSEEDAHALRAIFSEPTERPSLPLPSAAAEDDRSWLGRMKRMYAFEAGSAARQLGLSADPAGLLPYRYFATFTAALAGAADVTALLPEILRGISAAEGVPERAHGEGLALRVVNRGSDALAVVKQFPVAEFTLRVAEPGNTFAQGLADRLLLQHVNGAPTLAIGLDLFEFLCRAADGYLPGSEEQGALAEDLVTFKNQLLARPTRDAVIVEHGVRFHQVRVNSGRIQREEVVR